MRKESDENPLFIIEPTDPNSNGKLMLVRLYPILSIAFYSMLILVFYILFDPPEPILIPLTLIILLSIIGDVILYFAVKGKFAQYTEKIIIYEDGLESYHTFFYGLKNLNGFIEKDRILEVRVNRLKESLISGSQAKLSIVTKEGNSRIIGIRSMDATEQAIDRMSQLWEVRTTFQ